MASFTIATSVFLGAVPPLYVVWLMALKSLITSGDIPALAVRGNVIFLLATAFGLVFLLRELLKRTSVALIAASLFVVRFDMLDISLSGNEPFLFCALVLWSFYFLSKKKFLLSGTLAGLSIMARPEGAFCALLVGLVWLLFSRKKMAAFLASVMLPGLIWTAFAFAYYGTPIYHSLIAKMSPVYPLPPGFAMGAVFYRLKLWTTGSREGAYVAGMTGVVALCGFLFQRRAHECTWFVIPCFTGKHTPIEIMRLAGSVKNHPADRRACPGAGWDL